MKKQIKLDVTAAMEVPLNSERLPSGVTIEDLMANPNKAAMVLLPEVI